MTFTRQRVSGTPVEWGQPTHILPSDGRVAAAMLAIEDAFHRTTTFLMPYFTHLPSRVRSLLWILSAVPVLRNSGFDMPRGREVAAELLKRLPPLQPADRRLVASFLSSRGESLAA
jgi:hypothetical protein